MVPGILRACVHVAGGVLEPAVRTRQIFSLVPPGEPDQPAEDVVEFTLDRGVESVARSADILGMTAGVFGRMPRAAAIACGVGLFTATITFAASSTLSAPTTPPATPVAAAPEPLVVPDVRKQAYVFAKGTLEQDGFAWRVEGGVAGFAANVVVSQSPAPGSRVVPDGAPTVVLRLSRNGGYKQEGMPGTSRPTPARRPVSWARPSRSREGCAARGRRPARALQSRSQAHRGEDRCPPARLHRRRSPEEPADEIPLSVRAKRLAAWVDAHPQRTAANVNHWLYQHNWIVTGARFGWSDGAAALETLVAVDARVQKLWGVGAREPAGCPLRSHTRQGGVEVRARLAALRRDERGYSLIELLTAMTILGAVMTSLTVVLVSATNADVRMNQEFQAQTQARTALERFRREGHAACKADPVGAAAAVTLTYVAAGVCPPRVGSR